ncbi:MAG: metallopeptidase TldD-related protein [Burkholderiaceae bacterium]
MSGGAAPAGVFEERFDALARYVTGAARAGEALFAELHAERADYLRLNRGRVRQAGTVERATAVLRLIAGDRQARITCPLVPGRRGRAQLDRALGRLRDALARADADPFLAWQREPARSRVQRGGLVATPEQVVTTLGAAAGDADLIGFHAAGPVAAGLASNLGHRHFHEAVWSSFDFTVQVDEGRAVKETWSGRDWDAAAVAAAVAQAREHAALLRRPARQLAPGSYRALLAPHAVADLLSLLGWGGFSLRAQRTGQSPLARLQRGEVQFAEMFSLAEDLALHDVPRFQSDGFVRPDCLPLIAAGRQVDALVSPRSAREFGGAAGNGADDGEAPLAPTLGAGSLRQADALAALDTGLAISNLWYLNYSDRAACRVTGMTRFATLWVEDGWPVAPVGTMRFDDSLYRLFGPALQALTDEVRRMPSTETYDGRQFGGVAAPSALVSALTFTL